MGRFQPALQDRWVKVVPGFKFGAVLALGLLIGSLGSAQQPPPEPPAKVLYGFADIHVHEMANLGFGGSIIWGNDGGPIAGLGPIPRSMRSGHDATDTATHGTQASVLFHTLVDAYLFDVARHDEDGYPTFNSWPATDRWTHQMAYKDWLYRAYQGGLRLMVMLVVNSEDAFGRGENELPVVRTHVFQSVKAKGRSGNDMEALDWQVREAYRLQEEIDTTSGGPGQGWYRIVRDPNEARRVITEGKLAVVLGTELQHLFNCDSDRPPCSQETIIEGLNRLQAMGMNYVFPVHHKLNQFGGPARFTPLNNGPKEQCPPYDPPYEHDCSAVGLTELGKFLVNELISRGMFIDTEHMSLHTFNDTMDIAEQRHYPVMAGHVVPYDMAAKDDRTERAKTAAQLQRIFNVGGIVAPMPGTSFQNKSNEKIQVFCRPHDGGSAEQWANAYLYVLGLAGKYADHVALGSDWNGFAGWPGPQEKCMPKDKQLTYPYYLPAGLQPALGQTSSRMDVMKWPDESRTWDFNKVGAAQVGLEPDLLHAAVKAGLSEADLEPLYNSANAVVEVWAQMRNRKDEQSRHHLFWAPHSPFETMTFDSWREKDREVHAASGQAICRTRKGHKLGYLEGMSCVLVEAPDAVNSDAIEVAAYHDGRCLEGAREHDPPVMQRPCKEEARQRWYFRAVVGKLVRIVNSQSGQCLTSKLVAGEDTMTETPCKAGDLRQQWKPRRRGNTFELIDVFENCMEVKDQSRNSGAEVRGASCSGASNQLWSVEVLRQNDYELLYQADKDRFDWSNSASDRGYPFPVEVRPQLQICSASAGSWLGMVYGTQCVGKTYDGEVASTTEFERLFQAQ
jgi:microsomal dipeptidase-like Zn-dependent dipeptidase